MIDDKDVFLFYALLQQQYAEHVGYNAVQAAVGEMAPRFQKGFMMLLLGFLPDTVMSECDISTDQYSIVFGKYQHLSGLYYALSFLLESVREHPSYFKQLLAVSASTSNRGRMADVLAYVEALKKAGFRSEFVLPERQGSAPSQKEEKPALTEQRTVVVPDSTAAANGETAAMALIDKMTEADFKRLAKFADKHGELVMATLFGDVAEENQGGENSERTADGVEGDGENEGT